MIGSNVSEDLLRTFRHHEIVVKLSSPVFQVLKNASKITINALTPWLLSKHRVFPAY